MRRYQSGPDIGEIIPQGLHVGMMEETNAINKATVAKFSADEQEKVRMLKGRRPSYKKNEYGEEFDPAGQDRVRFAKELLKARKRTIEKADPGLTTGIGYNFYDLRGPAYLIYPVNVPFRNSLPRVGRVNDGYGTAANWKATRNFGSVYAGVLEGQRNAIATPDENNYVATYKEIGVERGASFTSQFAGEGYSDNVADEHLRGMHELWLQEEGLIIGGNSGTGSGNNGFALGTCPAPTVTGSTSSGSLGADYYTVYAVAITMLGMPNNLQYGYAAPFTVAGGLVPQSQRTNADGSTTLVNGGTSAISLASNTYHLSGTGEISVAFTPTQLAGLKGAFWFAWYVDVEGSNTTVPGNAVLAAITSLPTVTFASNAGWGTQTATAAGLSTDFSYQPSDFDGLLTYACTQGIFNNMGGATFTPLANGRVLEVENDLEQLWQLYQAQVDEIWCSVDAKVSLSNAVMATTGSGVQPAFHFNYTRDSQGNIMGGFVVDAYKSQFSMNASGGNALPLKIHPMMPPGTIYYHIKTNPYPASRVPFVAGMLVQRDYYSIEWPVVTRQWTFGTYCHEVLAHTMPWITSVRTGIGAYN